MQRTSLTESGSGAIRYLKWSPSKVIRTVQFGSPWKILSVTQVLVHFLHMKSKVLFHTRPQLKYLSELQLVQRSVIPAPVPVSASNGPTAYEEFRVGMHCTSIQYLTQL